MPAEKIAVVIVTFNAGKTLNQAIASVLNQQYSNLELIVIDGNSSDDTIEIVKGYGTKITNWISEPDKGIYDAMNKGIALATGKWIIFLGADDQLCDGILQEFFTFPPGDSTELIYGKIKIIESSKLQGSATDCEQLIEYNIPHQAIFYKKSLLDKLGGYDTRYRILSDYDLNIKIFEDGNLKKRFIDKPVALFSNVGISNRTIDYLFFSEKLSYYTTVKGLSATDKRLAQYYFFIGVALILKGEYRQGVRNLLHPVLYGGRRFYYLMLVGSFLLSLVGLGKKYKVA